MSAEWEVDRPVVVTHEGVSVTQGVEDVLPVEPRTSCRTSLSVVSDLCRRGTPGGKQVVEGVPKLREGRNRSPFPVLN